MTWEGEIPGAMKVLMADAQTSGGLLISVAEEKVEKLMGALVEHGVVGARVIGEVVAKHAGRIHVNG